jgi:6-pyruvoyltetrahydropterin/6-carboxytetrahydropterin synthase
MKLIMKHHFDASHKLPNYNGKCANLHGHRWEVEVEIDGPVNPETGMLIDFTVVKKLIDKYDHSYLNDVFVNPTAENIALALRQELLEALGSHVIYNATVRVWESPGCMIEVSGKC